MHSVFNLCVPPGHCLLMRPRGSRICHSLTRSVRKSEKLDVLRLSGTAVSHFALIDDCTNGKSHRLGHPPPTADSPDSFQPRFRISIPSATCLSFAIPQP